MPPLNPPLVTNTLTNAVRTIFLPFRKWSKNHSYGVRKGICDQGLKSMQCMTKVLYWHTSHLWDSLGFWMYKRHEINILCQVSISMGYWIDNSTLPLVSIEDQIIASQILAKKWNLLLKRVDYNWKLRRRYEMILMSQKNNLGKNCTLIFFLHSKYGKYLITM